MDCDAARCECECHRPVADSVAWLWVSPFATPFALGVWRVYRLLAMTAIAMSADTPAVTALALIDALALTALFADRVHHRIDAAVVGTWATTLMAPVLVASATVWLWWVIAIDTDERAVVCALLAGVDVAASAARVTPVSTIVAAVAAALAQPRPRSVLALPSVGWFAFAVLTLTAAGVARQYCGANGWSWHPRARAQYARIVRGLDHDTPLPETDAGADVSAPLPETVVGIGPMPTVFCLSDDNDAIDDIDDDTDTDAL